MVVAIIVSSCQGQAVSKPATREFEYKHLGWRFEAPVDFVILDSAQVSANYSRGVNAINETYNATPDLDEMQTLISLAKGQLNTFTATITPFDPAVDGDWDAEDANVKSIIVETLQSQAPGIQVDTSSAVELIDGLEFRKFSVISALPNNTVINVFVYSRLHMGFDFGITVTFADDKTGKELAAILASSKFDR